MKAGTSATQRYIAVHKIEVSDDVRCGILAFHAITECDSISQFCGKSKKMAWKIFCEVPHLLAELGGTHSPTAQTLSAAEEFVCRLYNPYGDINNIQSLRCTQFRKGAGKFENLPPMCYTLRHHILIANYQALIWRTSNVANQQIPCPTTSGWTFS